MPSSVATKEKVKKKCTVAEHNGHEKPGSQIQFQTKWTISIGHFSTGQNDAKGSKAQSLSGCVVTDITKKDKIWFNHRMTAGMELTSSRTLNPKLKKTSRTSMALFAHQNHKQS